MQIVTSTLEARLEPGQPRKPCVLVELYASDYIPPDAGFDPANAEELFAGIQIAWNGNEYRQELKQNPSIQKNQGKTLNSCSLSFSNLDRYMAAFIINTDVEGMWCVVRYVERDITDSSIVLFVGRLDQPGDLEMKSASLSAKQSVGSFTHEIPPDSFPPPGYIFKPQIGTFQQPVITEQGKVLSFFGRPLYRTAQWSSLDSTHYGDVIPYILGRVQLDTHSIIDVDTGTSVKGLHYISVGKLHAVVNIRQPIGAPYSQPLGVTVHLGEADGVGTQTIDPLFPDIGTTFPNLAYIGLYVTGSSANAVDPPPYVVCVAVGSYALPDALGAFTEEGPTDNPAYLWRHLMTDERVFNQPATLIDDAAVIEAARYCDELLLDETNAERRVLQTADFNAAGTAFINHRSTGLIDTEYYRTALGLPADPVFEREALYEDGGDITNPPDQASFGVVSLTRKRYTVNVPITERVNSLDFLHDTFYPASGMYHVTGANGKLQPRIEKPADNARLRSGTIVGATSLPVDDVTPWRASLAGEVLIGAHLTTSDVRTVTAANYSTAGNSVTLAKSTSGTITATVSGVTLSGGNNSNTPATGTVNIGGTPASGNTVTVTIEGQAVVYTLNSSDTTGTVAALLADLINANPTLKRIVSASWAAASPTVVTITSKIGTLTVAALSNAHNAAEELVRVMFNFDASNIKPDSFRWPLGNEQKPYNQVEIIHREASDDFALQPPLRINDDANQLKVRKKNVFKIDGTAIDNYNQAFRRANIAFSKIVEGAKFATWKTKTGRALLNEEGDVGCVSDVSTGLVNYLVRAEKIGVSGDAEITFTARQYSTTMFSDEAAAHDIRIPSTLRGAKPANVANFAIDTAGRGGIRLKWDVDTTEARVLTYRIERKDGAGSWYLAATVSGDTWTDHQRAIESVTKWRIVALAGGARESETPTEVTLDISTFYGTTAPTGSITVNGYTQATVRVAPPFGMNALGLASINRTRVRVYATIIAGGTTTPVDHWFEGGAQPMSVPVPTGKLISAWDSFVFEATYEFTIGLMGDTTQVGLIGSVGSQSTAARAALPAATTSDIGGVLLAADGGTGAETVVQGNDSRLYNGLDVLTDGATITWAWSNALFRSATVTLSGNRTLALSGVVAGAWGQLVVRQDATGGRTLTLPTSSKVVGTLPILTTTALAVDLLSFFYDGTNYLWVLNKNAVEPPALLTSLISYWKLNEASGTRLDSHLANHLTDNNTVTSATGKIGNAASFASASSEYLSIADNASLSVADEDFTIGAWVNMSAKASDRFFIAKDDNSSRDYGLYYSSGSDRFTFYVFTPGGAYSEIRANNLGIPAVSTWYYIVAWHDSVNNTLNIQVNNGTADSVAHSAGARDQSAPFWIGRGGGSGYVDGLIDEVGFWKRVLTSSERALLYGSGSGLTYPF